MRRLSERPATHFFTGCAGFHGSALAQKLVRETEYLVVNIDKFIYAGSLESLGEALAAPTYHIKQADVCDAAQRGQN